MSAWPEKDLEPVGHCPACPGAAIERLYCGLVDFVFAVAPGRWDVWRCKDCRSLFLDPRPTPESIHRAYQRYYTHGQESAPQAPAGTSRLREAWRRLTAGYLHSKYAVETGPRWRAGRWIVPLALRRRVQLDATVRHLALPASHRHLLDVGAGRGDFVALATSLGWEAEGLEPDSAAVAVARSLGRDVKSGSAEDLERYPGAYSAITLSHVLEHTYDPLATLRACHTALRQAGSLWVTLPNPGSSAHAALRSGWPGLDPPRHLVLPSRRALARLLADAGFDSINFAAPVRSTSYTLRWAAELRAANGRVKGTTRFGRGTRVLGHSLELVQLIAPQLADEIIVTARKS